MSCPFGGLKVLMHNAVVHQLAQIIEDTGAVVRVEALIPEFTPTATRRMEDLLVDVTVRSEMAKTHHGAPAAPGAPEQWQTW